MALEIRCPGCGRMLRVADEHAGKQVRCPACQQISIAPIAEQLADPLAAGNVAAAGEWATWHLRTPEGQTFGPITWQQVQNWAAEGRISTDCQLAEGAGGQWQPATEWFPGLAVTAAPRRNDPAAPTTYPWTPANPFAVGASGAAMTVSPGPLSPAGAYVAPHRGGLILVLGLLGFIVTCPILSLMAWVMGSHDLREMRAGRMDRGGEGLTQAGTVLGMILSLLAIIVCVLILFVILLAAVAGR